MPQGAWKDTDPRWQEWLKTIQQHQQFVENATRMMQAHLRKGEDREGEESTSPTLLQIPKDSERTEQRGRQRVRTPEKRRPEEQWRQSASSEERLGVRKRTIMKTKKDQGKPKFFRNLEKEVRHTRDITKERWSAQQRHPSAERDLYTWKGGREGEEGTSSSSSQRERAVETEMRGVELSNVEEVIWVRTAEELRSLGDVTKMQVLGEVVSVEAAAEAQEQDMVAEDGAEESSLEEEQQKQRESQEVSDELPDEWRQVLIGLNGDQLRSADIVKFWLHLVAALRITEKQPDEIVSASGYSQKQTLDYLNMHMESMIEALKAQEIRETPKLRDQKARVLVLAQKASVFKTFRTHRRPLDWPRSMKEEGVENILSDLIKVWQVRQPTWDAQRKARNSSRQGSRRLSTESKPVKTRTQSRICTRSSSVSSPPAPKVLSTGVIYEEGEHVVTELGGSISKSVFDCTLLVTDRVRRTVKFLCALARGIPIITLDWLEKVSNFPCAIS